MTGEKLLIQSAESCATLGFLSEVCTEVGSSAPESVYNSLVLARDCLRSVKDFSEEKVLFTGVYIFRGRS